MSVRIQVYPNGGVLLLALKILSIWDLLYLHWEKVSVRIKVYPKWDRFFGLSSFTAANL